MSYWERGSFLNQCGDCSFLQGFSLSGRPGLPIHWLPLPSPRASNDPAGRMRRVRSATFLRASCFVLIAFSEGPPWLAGRWDLLLPVGGRAGAVARYEGTPCDSLGRSGKLRGQGIF